MPMKAAIPFHRRSSNTSAPPKTLTEEEKIDGPRGMIPTYPPKMVAMRGCLVGTTEVMSQPLISRGKGEPSWEQRFQDIQQELGHIKEAVKGRAPVSMDALVQ